MASAAADRSLKDRMPRCPFCKHENATGADRCASCGAALTTIAESREDPQTSPAAQASAVEPQSLGRDRPPSGELANQLEALLRRGNLIGAIKRYREHTGRGLKESKEAVEAFARERQIPLKQIGCGSTALLLLILAAAFGAWAAFG
jgi:hypothetical protein